MSPNKLGTGTFGPFLVECKLEAVNGQIVNVLPQMEHINARVVVVNETGQASFLSKANWESLSTKIG